VLHVGIQINAVVDLAAALADEGQPQAIEEARAATDIGRGFEAREVAGGWVGRGNGAGGARRARAGSLRREVERELRRAKLRWGGLDLVALRTGHVRFRWFRAGMGQQ